jgi:hypothetical protein
MEPPHGSSPSFSAGGVIAVGSDPCCSSYGLPQAAPSAALGSFAVAATAGLASFAENLSGLAFGWVDKLTGAHPSSPASLSMDRVALHASRDGDLRYEFSDRPRAIRQLAMHPAGRYALATDEQGRVLLLDASDLSVLRMWKGQRDATVGWLLVSDMTAVDGIATHLVVICAPRRSRIDFFEPLGLERVASVKTPRLALCQLLYILHSGIGSCCYLMQHNAGVEPDGIAIDKAGEFVGLVPVCTTTFRFSCVPVFSESAGELLVLQLFATSAAMSEPS